jgi:hypothetical protein
MPTRRKGGPVSRCNRKAGTPSTPTREIRPRRTGASLRTGLTTTDHPRYPSHPWLKIREFGVSSRSEVGCPRKTRKRTKGPSDQRTNGRKTTKHTKATKGGRGGTEFQSRAAAKTGSSALSARSAVVIAELFGTALGRRGFGMGRGRRTPATGDRAAAPRFLSCLWCVSWWPPDPCPSVSIRGCSHAKRVGSP